MITVLNDYNIRARNTFRMNVSASKWIEYTEASDLPVLFSEVGDGRFRCIGEGSNMLFLGDYDGALLHSRILDMENSVSRDGAHDLRIGSGVVLDDVIADLASAGIWGLENLSLIPGTAGSAAVQNVGAYGVEIKDYITAVECYDRVQGRFVTLSATDCAFGYRDSVFKRPENRLRYVVTYINLRLPANGGPRLDYGHLRKSLSSDTPTAAEVREAVIAMRRAKLPDVDEVGSAGSFFKNPVITPGEFESLKGKTDGEIPHFITADGDVKVPAAWLIDKCGFKGRKLGGAAVWRNQPLVIVNATGKASPDDVVGLETEIINMVNNRFGITLRPEVDHIR